MKNSPLSPPPHSAPLSAEEIPAGRRLTQALVQVAAEHAREGGISEAAVVGALVSALGSVGAAIARAHDFDLVEYAEFLTGYLASVFHAESRKPVYH